VIGLWGDDAGATALPRWLRREERPDGAIAVVAGGSWWVQATEALAAGAAALVVVEPGETPVGELDALLESSTAGRVPVIVERQRVRPDCPVASAPHAFVAECSASLAELGGVVRDTIGVLRMLGGTAPELVEVDYAPRAVLADLRVGAVPASLVAEVLSDAMPGGFVRVTSLGATRVEVVVDIVAGRSEVVVTDADGSLRGPAVLEQPHRAALRRALARLDDRTTGDELDVLRGDAALAAALRLSGSTG
jgi:hypothetical protein